METKLVSKIVAVLMVIALPASVMSAETRGAMLYASNTASLNGTIFQRSSAVFPGDKVSVPAQSAVTLAVTGSSILVPALSNITFNGNSVSLETQSAVAVSTTQGMAAQIANIKISPAADVSTSYQVARYNGKIVIAAKQGAILIAGLARTETLAEGSTTVVADPEPQKPGAVPATRGAGMGELPTWVAVLIGVAAAAAAAAIAIATTGKPVSPSHP